MSVELKSTSAGHFGSAERGGHIKTERERKREINSLAQIVAVFQYVSGIL